MSEKRYWTRRSRPCRATAHRVSDRAVAQTFGTGLGAVAVLPAGVHRGRVKPSDLRRLEDLQRLPLIDKTIERDRQVARPFLAT